MSTNGSQDELAAARAFLAQSEAGRHVLELLKNPLTEGHLKALAKGLVPFLHDRVRDGVSEAVIVARALEDRAEMRCRELTARVAALERRFVEFEAKRIREIEQRAAMLELQLAKSLKNGGTWKAATEFEPGDVTTYKGAAWVCQEPNSNVRPGTSNCWRLLHKTIDGR
jgi:hypothetical protein